MIAGEKPFERANLRYIERYADYGNATCKTMLGKMYQEGGYGVDQDFKGAGAVRRVGQAEPGPLRSAGSEGRAG